MEADGLALGTGAYVLLVDMYVGMGELKKAMDTLEKLMAQEPEARLTPTKYLRLALLMAQHGMTEGETQERKTMRFTDLHRCSDCTDCLVHIPK